MAFINKPTINIPATETELYAPASGKSAAIRDVLVKRPDSVPALAATNDDYPTLGTLTNEVWDRVDNDTMLHFGNHYLSGHHIVQFATRAGDGAWVGSTPVTFSEGNTSGHGTYTYMNRIFPYGADADRRLLFFITDTSRYPNFAVVQVANAGVPLANPIVESVTRFNSFCADTSFLYDCVYLGVKGDYSYILMIASGGARSYTINFNRASPAITVSSALTISSQISSYNFASAISKISGTTTYVVLATQNGSNRWSNTAYLRTVLASFDMSGADSAHPGLTVIQTDDSPGSWNYMGDANVEYDTTNDIAHVFFAWIFGGTTYYIGVRSYSLAGNSLNTVINSNNTVTSLTASTSGTHYFSNRLLSTKISDTKYAVMWSAGDPHNGINNYRRRVFAFNFNASGVYASAPSTYFDHPSWFVEQSYNHMGRYRYVRGHIFADPNGTEAVYYPENFGTMTKADCSGTPVVTWQSTGDLKIPNGGLLRIRPVRNLPGRYTVYFDNTILMLQTTDNSAGITWAKTGFWHPNTSNMYTQNSAYDTDLLYMRSHDAEFVYHAASGELWAYAVCSLSASGQHRYSRGVVSNSTIWTTQGFISNLHGDMNGAGNGALANKTDGTLSNYYSSTSTSSEVASVCLAGSERGTCLFGMCNQFSASMYFNVQFLPLSGSYVANSSSPISESSAQTYYPIPYASGTSRRMAWAELDTIHDAGTGTFYVKYRFTVEYGGSKVCRFGIAYGDNGTTFTSAGLSPQFNSASGNYFAPGNFLGDVQKVGRMANSSASQYDVLVCWSPAQGGDNGRDYFHVATRQITTNSFANAKNFDYFISGGATSTTDAYNINQAGTTGLTPYLADAVIIPIASTADDATAGVFDFWAVVSFKAGSTDRPASGQNNMTILARKIRLTVDDPTTTANWSLTEITADRIVINDDRMRFDNYYHGASSQNYNAYLTGVFMKLHWVKYDDDRGIIFGCQFPAQTQPNFPTTDRGLSEDPKVWALAEISNPPTVFDLKYKHTGGFEYDLASAAELADGEVAVLPKGTLTTDTTDGRMELENGWSITITPTYPNTVEATVLGTEV